MRQRCPLIERRVRRARRAGWDINVMAQPLERQELLDPVQGAHLSALLEALLEQLPPRPETRRRPEASCCRTRRVRAVHSRLRLRHLHSKTS